MLQAEHWQQDSEQWIYIHRLYDLSEQIEKNNKWRDLSCVYRCTFGVIDINSYFKLIELRQVIANSRDIYGITHLEINSKLL